MPYFTHRMLDFFNTIWVSNSFDPDQVDILSGLIWVQETVKVQRVSADNKVAPSGKELNTRTKQLVDHVDTTYFLAKANNLILAPIFPFG